MQYSFERLRFHFIEHAAKQIWQDGNATATVIENLQRELDRSLSEDEAQILSDRIRFLYSETDKLLRSRTPHDLPSGQGAIELWGYQQIRPLHPDTYIHHEQPSQSDFDNHFVLPEGEVWSWNVVYTFTGPYCGIQADTSGRAATRSVELGDRDLVLQSAQILKLFPSCEVLGELTPDNLDLFTLEADECVQISRTLQQQEAEAIAALSQVLEGGDRDSLAANLLSAWQIPLQAAQNEGIAQFKRGKPLQTIATSADET